MVAKPYVIFRLHDTRYAIAAESVMEIFSLPELIPIAEAPPDILGLLNFHKLYIPVMHLDLRFGHQFERCHLTDSVIAIESSGLQVGVIVHQVETVIDIDSRYIQQDLDYGRERSIEEVFVRGMINLDDETIVLLNIDNLIRHPHALVAIDDPDGESSELAQSVTDFYDSYFPTASDNVREILSSRAANLRVANDDRESINLIPVAIVKLNGGYFGLDLAVVREFTKLGRITTIPCCPPHIIGNMNLRGEILTLIDICQPLNLVVNNRQPATKAIVIEFDDITAGIVVEEVIDVVDFRPEELKTVPVATDTNTAAYIKGMVDYLDRSLNIIDLPKLLNQGVMTVELAA
ncbi:chemotaxis protein CheW [Waterburya agarophytonicola K14]|uniref:Chemotaxis protein CheW n=1 Tax=Waterburya agarophytonicola KI4 TaxID=2874699 RepID=A0A964FF66_9CYAN|nr:chemotaxis protein CheW [Waterburya agarophytonicola]MCC0176591.1 chemotaxis protein CheW [Waterburya agarophytonicola KI4]